MTVLMEAPGSAVAATTALDDALDDAIAELRARHGQVRDAWEERATTLRLLRPSDGPRRSGGGAVVDAFVALLAAGDRQTIASRARALGHCLTMAGVAPAARTGAILALHDAASRALADAPPGVAPDARRIAFERAAIRAVTACLTRTRPATDRRAAPTGHRSLIVLVTGAPDPSTAPRLTAHLLATVRDARATLLVIDVTSLPALDDATTRWVMLTAEAARWLGAAVVVSGAAAVLAPVCASPHVDPTRWNIAADLRGSIALAP